MIVKVRIPFFVTLNAIKWKILIVAIVATIMGYFGDYLDTHAEIRHPIGIPAFLGTALVFVLAFRTNQAYDRWWEARKIWGSIVNDTRSFTRMLLALVQNSEEKKEQILRRQIGWNYFLTKKLRRLPYNEEDTKYFTDHEKSEVLHSINPCTTILRIQSKDLKKLLDDEKVNDLHHILLEELLISMEKSLGKVERIKNTTFPALYDWIVQMTIYFFAALLALAIVDQAHVFEILFTILLCTIFLFLQQISTDLQDPFENQPSDIPITTISISMERGILQSLGYVDDLPEIKNENNHWIN